MKGLRARHARIGDFLQLVLPKPVGCVYTAVDPYCPPLLVAHASSITGNTAPLAPNPQPLQGWSSAPRLVGHSLSSSCQTIQRLWPSRPAHAFVSQAPFQCQQLNKWQLGCRVAPELSVPHNWQHLKPVSTYRQPGCPVQFGQSWSLSRVFNAFDVDLFSSLTGDGNPIHSDQAAAEAAGFAKPVGHGMLAASLFPAIMGSRFVSTRE